MIYYTGQKRLLLIQVNKCKPFCVRCFTCGWWCSTPFYTGSVILWQILIIIHFCSFLPNLFIIIRSNIYTDYTDYTIIIVIWHFYCVFTAQFTLKLEYAVNKIYCIGKEMQCIALCCVRMHWVTLHCSICTSVSQSVITIVTIASLYVTWIKTIDYVYDIVYSVDIFHNNLTY